MKLKTLIVCGAAMAVLMGSCIRQPSQYTPEGKHFVTDVMNGMTPVKDQGESETCWIYAMLADRKSTRLNSSHQV